MKGQRAVTIPDVGVDLVLTIRGQEYAIAPSTGDVLRLQAALQTVETDDESLSLDAQAAVADALLTHLAGSHAEFFATLPVQQQSAIAAELWAWYVEQGEGDPAPFVELSESHGTPASASGTYSGGPHSSSVASNGPATSSGPNAISEP